MERLENQEERTMNNFYREFKPGTTAVNLIDIYGVKIVGKIGTWESSYIQKTDAITYLKIILTCL